MNINKSKPVLLIRDFLFVAIIISPTISLISSCSSTPNQTSLPLPSTPLITNTPSNEEQITAAFKNAISQAGMQPPEGETFQPMDIQIEGEWAIIEATYVDNLGTPTVGEGSVFIGRLINGEWEIAIPGTEIYKSWLEIVPESLLSDELKQLLR